MYYAFDGRPAAVHGSFGIRSTYTAFGRLESETWLDGEGNAAVNGDGYAGVLYDYDLSNSSQVEKYFRYYVGTDGTPCAASNGAWGMSVLYYPATLIRKVTFLDARGEPVVTSEGYAILEYEDDVNGNRVWEGYYDDLYAQTECLDGYSSKECDYDSNGRLISERYMDRYNRLTNNAQGVAGWRGYYDPDGNLVITSIYDQNRNALPLDNQ
jgi:YD repeat-containing protein